MTKPVDSRPWISLRGVGRVLDASPKVAARLARTGKLRSRLLPGMPRQFALADAQKIAAEAEARGNVATLGA